MQRHKLKEIEVRGKKLTEAFFLFSDEQTTQSLVHPTAPVLLTKNNL